MDTAAEQRIRNTERRRHTTKDAAAAEQEETTNRRQIPPEIVEIILIHLPIESLHRFSRVSKLFGSLIFEPSFMKKRPHPCRLLMTPRPIARHNPVPTKDVSSCPLSSISSDSAVADATPMVFPVEGKPILRASCNELLCVEINNSHYLCNPSTNVYKKLPHPSIPSVVGTGFRGFVGVYGLGYDSVNDDYKILRLSSFRRKSELYSLKCDSWKMMDYSPLLGGDILPREIVFVGGAFHLWTNHPSNTIISFDLATEKYGNVAPPPPEELRGEMEVSALRGKLCTHSCRPDGIRFRFVMWVMEEYGIEKSWTKIFDLKYCDVAILQNDGIFSELTPLYLFDNGEILFRLEYYGAACKSPALYMYKGEETRPWKIFPHGISDVFMYEESLFSPASIAVHD